jgi:adenosylhomocysteine nucleosidase
VIAFLAAMRQEARPLLRRIGRHTRGSIGRFRCHRFELAGRPCLLLETGVGRARATEAARALLSEERPRLVVSVGIAGAPLPGLRVGDLVEATAVATLAGGVLGPTRRLARLAPEARQAAERAAASAGARMHPGTVITTWAEQSVDWPGPEPCVLDMETAAIEEACAESGVPLAGLRSVSDSVDEPLPFDLSRYMDSQQQLRMGRFLAAVLRRPALLPALVRVGRNASRAADVAAAAAIAAVAVPGDTVDHAG